jgi:alpha-glucosidase
VAAALGLRRRLLAEGCISADDGAVWRVEEDGLLICERGQGFFVAVAMGDAPVRLPAGTVLLSTVLPDTPGWLAPDNAVWVRRG